MKLKFEKEEFCKVYDELQSSQRVAEYFNTTNPKDQTGAGLCIHLGISKSTYNKYANGSIGEEAAEAIAWAKTRLEHKYALDLNYKPNPTGPIFALKQLGWRDNQDVDVKTSGFEIVCNVPRPEEK